jgi:ketosteroid isomerase-like protein
MTPQETDNCKLAAKLLECYEGNDHDGLIDLVTKDCVFMIGGKTTGPVPYHGTHIGHDQVRSYLLKRRANSMRMRDDCMIRPPTQASAPAPDTEKVGAPMDPDKVPKHERFIAQGNVVIALGHLKNKFADGKPMHHSDFVLVFKVNEAEKKISSFQYFFDTEGAAEAWRKDGRSHAY